MRLTEADVIAAHKRGRSIVSQILGIQREMATSAGFAKPVAVVIHRTSLAPIAMQCQEATHLMRRKRPAFVLAGLYDPRRNDFSSKALEADIKLTRQEVMHGLA